MLLVTRLRSAEVLPTFAIVTVCESLVVLVGTSPKSNAVGVIENWLIPYPVRLRLYCCPNQLPVAPGKVSEPSVVGVKW